MTLTVLQIIPNLGAGGAEQACVDVAVALKQSGAQALVVSAGGRRVAELEAQGIEHIQHPVSTKNPFKIYQNALWLRRLIKARHVDIVHARSRAPAWSAWLACRSASCRFVTTFHAAYKFESALKRAYNSVMAKGDRVIAISNFVADYVQKSYGVDGRKLRVIYRGVDFGKFAPEHVTEARRAKLRQLWALPEGKRVILLPARLSPIKGQAVLIKAMAQVKTQAPDAIAVIIGDDQGRRRYRQELEVLIETEKLQGKVLLVAHCDDMPAAYSLADLVAMPSKVAEGFGRVPVEAMAMGVPVIASALGATPETIIEGRTGWLLLPDQPRVWADAIRHALTLPSEQRHRMAEAAQQWARTHFDNQTMVAQTLAVYDEVTASPRSCPRP